MSDEIRNSTGNGEIGFSGKLISNLRPMLSVAFVPLVACYLSIITRTIICNKVSYVHQIEQIDCLSFTMTKSSGFKNVICEYVM